MVNEGDDLRSEIRLLIASVESLIQQMGQVHAHIPIPPQDELMLLGEADPDFVHVVRVVLECSLGDYLKPLLRDLQKLVDPVSPGDRPA